MFKELLNNVQDKYKKIQEENALYNKLLETTNVVSSLIDVPIIDKKSITVSYMDILNLCPDLNDEKALLIRGLIPIDEVYLTVMYTRECKSNTEYFLVPTNKYLWVIGTSKYVRYSYTGLSVGIIKNNLMGKVLNLANILFDVNGGEEKINEFMKIINDSDYREIIIKKKLEKFCGIKPKFSLINDLGAGISIDEEKNIVFHTGDANYKYNIKELTNYELLLDDNVVMEKRSNRRVRLTANKSSCYQMNIRVSTKDNTFLVPIIVKSAFVEVYQSTSAKYMNARIFAEKIINILDDLDEANLNGD